MSATKEHDLIVALVTRFIQQQGFEIVALESSMKWLFGDSFKLPPTIARHRPDVLGVRRDPPFISIGEAKTCSDLKSRRTQRQLVDFSQAEAGNAETLCQVVVGIPQNCESNLRKLLVSLTIPDNRVTILPIPRALLINQRV